MIVYLLVYGQIFQASSGWFSFELFAHLASGLGTVVLGGCAVLTYRYVKSEIGRWKVMKRQDKVSNTAESILNDLDLVDSKLKNWLDYVQFVYDKRSQANETIYKELSKEDKRRWDEDRDEVRNYVKDLNDILKIIIKAKNRSCRISKKDKTIEKEINQLKKRSRALIGDLQHKLSDDKKLKIEGMQNLSNAHAEIEKLVSSIRNKLCNLLMYD